MQYPIPTPPWPASLGGVGGCRAYRRAYQPPHPPKAGRPWGGGYWILHWYWILGIGIGYWILGIGYWVLDIAFTATITPRINYITARITVTALIMLLNITDNFYPNSQKKNTSKQQYTCFFERGRVFSEKKGPCQECPGCRPSLFSPKIKKSRNSDKK